jgi:ATP-binding cassette subfamily F protein 3
MISVHGLGKSYGLQPLFRDVSFTVNAGERVGLIGPNGSGKSALLRILAGRERPDSGHVKLQTPDLRIGYLAQGFEFDPGVTIDQTLETIGGDRRSLEDELSRLAEALANRPQSPELQSAYDAALSELEQVSEGRARAVLASFGLDGLNKEQRLASLSGGQKTRLALAHTVLSDPQLLLLDEPTNHLDIEMLKWLEDWMGKFPGGALVVSHDRTFLDQTVSQILYLDPHEQTVRHYAGNYSSYIDQYLGERAKQLSAYKDQLVEIRRMRQDIHRTMEQARGVERTTTPRQPNVRRLAKKVARKGKSREKRLERYLSSSERVDKPGRSWQMNLQLSDAPPLGRDVLSMSGLSVGYPGYEPLLIGLEQHVLSGQRIVLTGPNGSGKTTLLRTLAGHLEPLAGRMHLGATVRLGYLAQEQESLAPELSPVETIEKVATMDHTAIRSFLHFFLFTNDHAFRPVKKLSFGERVRLSLAVLVASGCNLLILDEPINHLDIPSRELFEQALVQFHRTVLAVVHDRYFISRFATDLWVVEHRQLRSEILRR